MKRLTSLLFILLLMAVDYCSADALDSLQALYRDHPQIQEKVYVHTDNTCYFVGDTIWYKTYVVRADNLCPTDMSKMLYVELLTPDGLVKERQCVAVSAKGYGEGQFAIDDSSYSGYYEIRAYTRWMLNFNVREHRYSRDDKMMFFNNQMAKDFFRVWDGLYSRVFPVYSRPKTAGDYDGKYMFERPKQTLLPEETTKLHCAFYPEGGVLVGGVRQRVAFELTDQDGAAVDTVCTLSDGQRVNTLRLGRGSFTVNAPAGQKMQLSVHWMGKDWTFDLPEAEPRGTALSMKGNTVELSSVGCQPAAYAILCRGRMCKFERISGDQPLTLDTASLPSGVNELQVYDAAANVLASRMFFVNHHDRGLTLTVSTDKTDYEPYEQGTVSVAASAADSAEITDGLVFSLSVRDAHTDDPTFDDGDMLEDMLLCSDLKGFVVSPSYYFERDDEEHRANLDLLMLIQGWRKYARAPYLRYTPEQSLTVEGEVYQQPAMPILDVNDLTTFTAGTNESLDELPSSLQKDGYNSGLANQDDRPDIDGSEIDAQSSFTQDESSLSYAESAGAQDEKNAQRSSESNALGYRYGGIKKEVYVEAELTKGTSVAGAVQMTKHRGHFLFNLPPFTDEAILTMKAYTSKDSVKKNMQSAKPEKGMFDETQYPDFYVRRSLFYPVFAHPYSYYQTHQPDTIAADYDVSEANEPSLQGDHVLQTVHVKARRRGRRALDLTKPAFIVDGYELYNEATDRGLSWGVPNLLTFPRVAAFTLFGNFNMYKDFTVKGMLEDRFVFYPAQKGNQNRSAVALYDALLLSRLYQVHVYTDYVLRNEEADYFHSTYYPDVTIRYINFSDGGKQPVSRDRRIVVQGITTPEQFYQPDYSHQRPAAPTDYRRTLYWNPNAKLDAGEFHDRFFNNSRTTRVRISIAGVTNTGKFIGTK